nr:MAG TPA: Transcription activator BRG1, BRK domain, SWI/SNF, chromatin [Caudoviricetes sp.]
MGTPIRLRQLENRMQEAYVLTPIMAHSTPDDWVERIAKRKGEKDLRKIAQGFLAPKDFEKWLKRHPEYKA